MTRDSGETLLPSVLCALEPSRDSCNAMGRKLCGRPSSCVCLIHHAGNLKWQFLCLTHGCLSSDLKELFVQTISCSLLFLSLTQIFIGLCSTSVKFQIKCILFSDCATRGSSKVTLTAQFVVLASVLTLMRFLALYFIPRVIYVMKEAKG